MKKKVYIFIPGYYGSTLIDKNSNRLIWGDPKELFFRRSSLAMSIPGIKIKGALDLHPHEVIPDMQILGGLVKEEAYNKTINFLKSLEPQDIIKVAWDWRKDPMSGLKILDDVRIKAQKKYLDCELILISHSYGSLIASYYLRYGTQEYFEAKETWEGLKYFKKVILSATPYRGLMAIFRNMHKGIKFGLNLKMQNALSFSTFESSYFLIPPKGHDRIKDSEGNSINLNLHHANNWFDKKWGLFHEQHGLTHSEELKKYLTENLARAEKFHQLMDQDLVNMPVDSNKILYLYGLGFKTLHEGVWLTDHVKKNIFLYYPKDFKKHKFKKIKNDEIYGDGDLTVPDFSLKLPKAFEKIGVEIHNDKLGHLDILQHPRSQNRILQFLNS
jgi:hypothetical protein